MDHVTGGEVVATFAGWRAERAERIRLLMARRGPVAVGAAVGVAGVGVGVAEVEWCTCPIECEEGGPCPEGCPCGCEPRPSEA